MADGGESRQVLGAPAPASVRRRLGGAVEHGHEGERDHGGEHRGEQPGRDGVAVDSDGVEVCGHAPFIAARSRNVTVTNEAARAMMPPEAVTAPTDEELLASHDTEAFGMFYDRHARTLLGYFQRRTGDPQVAADLTAETFASAIVAQERYVPTGAPALAWLYRSPRAGSPTTSAAARWSASCSARSRWSARR